MTASIVQFVCFETPLKLPAFMAQWAPFASSFLARGIRRIVLAQVAELAKIPPARCGAAPVKDTA
jgi:hypothetical protein